MEIKVLQSDRESKGFFKALEGDMEVGRMTYSWSEKDTIIIDHTEVNPEFKGKSIGNKMVMAAVSFAQEHTIKIIPLCPFVKSVFDKTPEIRDVL